MIFIAVLAFAALSMASVIPKSNPHLLASLGVFNSPEANEYLFAHNKVRLFHDAPPLVWNSTLASKAHDWAATCQVTHSDGTLLDTPYGENIVAATGNFPIDDAVAQFTLDASEYDPTNPTYNHFTQVVWKSTTQLGCSLAHCGGIFDASLGQASYYVCLYDPAGNVIGDASANVKV
ncbi:PR-1-like protein [Mycena vulgaris]|nr:PR-1-like protein [Mycena vulgaris]